MPRIKPPSKEESLLLPPFNALPDNAIHVPQTPDAFSRAYEVLMRQAYLGFDTESKPIFHVHQPDTGPHVVQLATTDAAWILQLHIPQALELARAVIQHPSIVKVGFGLDNDKSTLPKRLGVPLVNVLDLDRVFKSHGYGASTGVRAAIALVLGQNFHKSKKQSTSNWSLPVLSEAQIRYAANDAHGPAMVYAALPAWQAAQPPLPTTRPPRKDSAKTATTPTAQSTGQTAYAKPRQAALFQPPKWK